MRMLDGRRVVFLIPLPRTSWQGAAIWWIMPPTDPDFEANIRTGLMEVRGFFKDFLFSSNLRGFKLLNPGLCVPSADSDSDSLWGDENPVHPLYNGCFDTIMKEADNLRTGGKRPGDDINPAAKNPASRPRGRAGLTSPREA